MILSKYGHLTQQFFDIEFFCREEPPTEDYMFLRILTLKRAFKRKNIEATTRQCKIFWVAYSKSHDSVWLHDRTFKQIFALVKRFVRGEFGKWWGPPVPNLCIRNLP